MCANITKCYGEACPVRNNCYRFTADANEMWQSYFTDAPGKTEDGKFTCEMYWGEKSQSIFNQLKDITDGKDNTGV